LSNSPDQDDKIMSRALALVNAHSLKPQDHLITIAGLNGWRIKSSVGGYSTVEWNTDDYGYNCNCPYYQHKGECKHIKAIKIVRERAIYCPMSTEDDDNGI